MRKDLAVLYALSWIPALLIKLVLAIIGLLVVLIATQFDEDSRKWPKIFWLWGNDEEGCPVWWKRRGTAWWWYAIRNPVNNMRFLFKDEGAFAEYSDWPQDLKMEAQQLIEAGQGSAYRWRTRGWQSGFRRVWLNGNDKYSELWFGWKVGSDVPGLGLTAQMRLKRKVGT